MKGARLTKMKEQTGNVIENKGSLCREGSGALECGSGACGAAAFATNLSWICWLAERTVLNGDSSKLNERTGNVTENKGRKNTATQVGCCCLTKNGPGGRIKKC
jgi:hypothetical protein